MDELRGPARWRRWLRRAVRAVVWAAGRVVRAGLWCEVVLAPSSAERAGRGYARLLRDALRRGRLQELPDVAIARGLVGEGGIAVGSRLEALVDQAVERLCRSRGPGLPNGGRDDPCMFSSEEFGE